MTASNLVNSTEKHDDIEDEERAAKMTILFYSFPSRQTM